MDYAAARTLLEVAFVTAERDAFEGKEPVINEQSRRHFDAIFQSATQAYREVFLGCILAKLSDRRVDITKPYMGQGSGAYNGRTLDEKVVNPFLHDKRIPASKGPFLSTFRRSVRFNESTREGLRDKQAYDSLLVLIKALTRCKDETEIRRMLAYILFRFLGLRSASEVPLSKLQRISLEQYGRLIEALLGTQSGGRFPVMLVEATLKAVKHTFTLDWTIEVQGINVADKPARTGADITVRHADTVVLAMEITERSVDKTRIVSTFQTKIAPQGIEDYLFLVTEKANEEAMKQARQYFSQGHEINFFEIKNWILVILATLAQPGRAVFNEAMLNKLVGTDIPVALKVAWNKQIGIITAV